MRVPYLLCFLHASSLSLANRFAKKPKSVSPHRNFRSNIPLGWLKPNLVPCPPLIMQTATWLKLIYLILAQWLSIQVLQTLWIGFWDLSEWWCCWRVESPWCLLPSEPAFQHRHVDIVGRIVDSQLILADAGIYLWHQPIWWSGNGRWVDSDCIWRWYRIHCPAYFQRYGITNSTHV